MIFGVAPITLIVFASKALFLCGMSCFQVLNEACPTLTLVAIVRAKVFVARTKLFLTDTLSTVFGRAFSTVHTRDLYQPLRGRYKTLKRIQVLLGNVSNTLDPVT